MNTKRSSHKFLELDNAKSDFLTRMREQWMYLKGVFENDHKVFKKIKKAKSIDHYNDAIDWIFEQEIKSSLLD